MQLSIGCDGSKPTTAKQQSFDFGIGDYVQRKSGRKNIGRVISIYQTNAYKNGKWGKTFVGYKWMAKVRWENVYQRIGGGTSLVGSISVDSLVKINK